MVNLDPIINHEFNPCFMTNLQMDLEPIKQGIMKHDKKKLA